ncbi:MAG: hypothetical protein ACE5D8_05270 [Fidelibacterota bacterium]
MLPFEHSWLPFIYLYGLGGILFLLGIYITSRAGALDMKRPKHRIWMAILFFGYIWYFSIHGLLNLAAMDYIKPATIFIFLTILAIGFLIYLRFMLLRLRKEA